ncbi:MAG: SUMF1/EgtB/PvdO family nonheme iron enzyme [Planctomycetes bacterium]|nr:SUMF1/EgtB/PvdO family nonheme iron enzyme [Planctomycetota bacterium]
MNTLNNMLAEIVADPTEETRWLVLADWLEEHDDVRRGELLRLHRMLLGTCCEPDAHPERKAWQARIVELIAAGVRPCVPQREVQLPGGVCMTLSFIPPGSFLMGGNASSDERPIRKVTLTHGFFMGVHPVTQAQWKAVVGTDPSYFKGANRPVEQVSWEACQEFCEKLTAELSGRGRVELPTEAEWEYACRAGTTTEYHFGDALNTDLANCDRSKSPTEENRKKPTDVGLFPRNGWGLFDVHGNVWEFCAGWCRSYPHSSPPDSPETEPSGRVLRGGSWYSLPEHCRAASRRNGGLQIHHISFGFRVCLRLD